MAWPTEQGQVGQDEEGQQIRCGPEHGTQEVWGPVKGGRAGQGGQEQVVQGRPGRLGQEGQVAG